MLHHEFEELSNDSSSLEKALKEGLEKAGLETLVVRFQYVGDGGPGMFIGTGHQISDPKLEQLMQLAQSMGAAQAARIRQAGGAVAQPGPV